MLARNAIIEDEIVTIEKSRLEIRRERGGDGKISGYKITPLFFVYSKNCKDNGNTISFHIGSVKQLKPTIAGKIFFKKLRHNMVKEYYGF